MDETNQQSAGQIPEQRDVSRQTMVVLVILAIVVSLLGTFTVIKETSGNNVINVNKASLEQRPSTQGEIRLEIIGDSANVPQADSATGRVVMEIANSN